MILILYEVIKSKILRFHILSKGLRKQYNFINKTTQRFEDLVNIAIIQYFIGYGIQD